MKSILKYLILCLICVGYFFFDHQNNFESFNVVSEKPTPVFSYSTQEELKTPVIAILLHGFRCNKSQMVPMAKYLAKQGIHSFVLDLPGHGLATTTWEGSNIGALYINQAIKEIQERDAKPDQKIVLVGWSIGAEFAKHIVQINKDIYHSILIGTSMNNIDFIHSTNNLLILNEPNPNAFDEFRALEPYLLDYKGKILDARNIPNSTHLSIVYMEETFRQVANSIFKSLSSIENTKVLEKKTGLDKYTFTSILILSLVVVVLILGLISKSYFLEITEVKKAFNINDSKLFSILYGLILGAIFYFSIAIIPSFSFFNLFLSIVKLKTVFFLFIPIFIVFLFQEDLFLKFSGKNSNGVKILPWMVIKFSFLIILVIILLNTSFKYKYELVILIGIAILLSSWLFWKIKDQIVASSFSAIILSLFLASAFPVNSIEIIVINIGKWIELKNSGDRVKFSDFIIENSF